MLKHPVFTIFRPGNGTWGNPVLITIMLTSSSNEQLRKPTLYIEKYGVYRGIDNFNFFWLTYFDSKREKNGVNATTKTKGTYPSYIIVLKLRVH